MDHTRVSFRDGRKVARALRKPLSSCEREIVYDLSFKLPNSADSLKAILQLRQKGLKTEV
jgi:hypothetical protein